MKIQITCPVFPTEDEKRIEGALSNLFHHAGVKYCHLEQCSNISFNLTERNELSVLRQYIHELRIIDVVRRRLEANLNGTVTSFNLDKQAASLGKLRLLDDTDDAPSLGSIEIIIDFKNETELDSFMSWFVPLTKDGRI
ncbi:MAG: RNA-binding domain-containing protein, partial [Candidatus Thorarchaeota archaeon]